MFFQCCIRFPAMPLPAGTLKWPPFWSRTFSIWPPFSFDSVYNNGLFHVLSTSVRVHLTDMSNPMSFWHNKAVFFSHGLQQMAIYCWSEIGLLAMVWWCLRAGGAWGSGGRAAGLHSPYLSLTSSLSQGDSHALWPYLTPMSLKCLFPHRFCHCFLRHSLKACLSLTEIEDEMLLLWTQSRHSYLSTSHQDLRLPPSPHSHNYSPNDVL